MDYFKIASKLKEQNKLSDNKLEFLTRECVQLRVLNISDGELLRCSCEQLSEEYPREYKNFRPSYFKQYKDIIISSWSVICLIYIVLRILIWVF